MCHIYVSVYMSLVACCNLHREMLIGTAGSESRRQRTTSVNINFRKEP